MPAACTAAAAAAGAVAAAAAGSGLAEGVAHPAHHDHRKGDENDGGDHDSGQIGHDWHLPWIGYARTLPSIFTDRPAPRE